jgi:eukaryotic-like serine/threonine-protein kinase
MQLWTDYEGVTIDGAFRLQKLLMPEGRSAFYSTAGPNGEPTVVRLIECHFDEEDILARWRCIDALSHPNFLKFERFGQTELDGRPVVYAVFENVDTNLAEVLDQGHLDVKDVAQLASSLVAALDVLHTHGFIHEHVEPRNIFAISGGVKLRGDCIREAPEGEEGRALKQRDVHDLATVLLQGLTQRESIEGIPDSALPPPFGQIIRNGLDGSWGLDDIRAALGRQFGSNQQPAPASVNAAPATVAEQKVESVAAKPRVRPEARVSLPPRKEERNAGFAGATVRNDRWSHKESWGDEQNFSLRSRAIGAGGAALLLLLCSWIVAHAWHEHQHEATQGAAVSQPAMQSVGQSAAPSAKQSSTGPAPNSAATDLPRASLPASAGSRADWRVITFTYNRKEDAEKKVSDLARSHPELAPVVFSPSGQAPYLVSIGGLMDRDAARALARRNRSLGLPHDTYAQNYSR